MRDTDLVWVLVGVLLVTSLLSAIVGFWFGGQVASFLAASGGGFGR